MAATRITVAFGDGIGPEIMESALHILREAGAQLEVETIEIGKRIYDMNAAGGILPGAWESLQRTKILLKAPIIVPPEEMFKHTNSVLRETFGLSEIMPNEAEPLATSHAGGDFIMFEPTHGPAPELAGKNKANPSGMIAASVLLLRHIGQEDVADKIHNAWRRTLEDGIHTRDIYKKSASKEKASTEEFTQAVVARLGKKPVK